MEEQEEEPVVRRCRDCGEVKPATEFNWRNRAREQRSTQCRDCRSAYHRRHYRLNRDRYAVRIRRRQERVTRARMDALIAYLRTHPCVDCGEADTSVLEFDHRGDKAFNISHGFRDRPWQMVVEEMAKCDVRCANCHRRRTVESRGWLRAWGVDDVSTSDAREDPGDEAADEG